MDILEHIVQDYAARNEFMGSGLAAVPSPRSSQNAASASIFSESPVFAVLPRSLMIGVNNDHVILNKGYFTY